MKHNATKKVIGYHSRFNIFVLIGISKPRAQGICSLFLYKIENLFRNLSNVWFKMKRGTLGTRLWESLMYLVLSIYCIKLITLFCNVIVNGIFFSTEQYVHMSKITIKLRIRNYICQNGLQSRRFLEPSRQIVPGDKIPYSLLKKSFYGYK